jgi:hypothetical protein
LAFLFLKGLDTLKNTDVFPYPATDSTVPWEEQDKTLLITDNGDELEQSLVKLLAVQPIYEFRIDVNKKEYFRAIFFPFTHLEEKIIIVLQMPLLKLLEIMGATKQMFTGIALKGFMKTLGEDLKCLKLN